MNERQALEAAKQIGVPEGESITMQNEKMFKPHLHKGGKPPLHVDAWAVHNDSGVLSAEKFHTPPS